MILGHMEDILLYHSNSPPPPTSPQQNVFSSFYHNYLFTNIIVKPVMSHARKGLTKFPRAN